MMKKVKPLQILISIAIAFGIGIIGSFLGDSSGGYHTLAKPSFTPPSIIFPIVWPILYILMGVSAYFAYNSNSPIKKTALAFYFVQLFVNSLWTLFFFKLGMLLFAFWWLILLIILVVITAVLFYKIKPIILYLLIPYILWLCFAAVLNYSIYLLN
jgi:tryptophan-rich sensory protein